MNRLSSHAAVFLQKSCSDAQKHRSPGRTALISQQRAAMSLITFFCCHLGAPCITATIKIMGATKISLPKGVWVSKGALLDHVGTGCGMLHAGRGAQQLWVGQCQLWSWAALMESSALMTKQNFSKGIGNARPWVYQTFTELGKLLWKNLIQSDWAPAALTGLPDPLLCPDKMPLFAFHADQ